MIDPYDSINQESLKKSLEKSQSSFARPSITFLETTLQIEQLPMLLRGQLVFHGFRPSGFCLLFHLALCRREVLSKEQETNEPKEFRSIKTSNYF